MSCVSKAQGALANPDDCFVFFVEFNGSDLPREDHQQAEQNDERRGNVVPQAWLGPLLLVWNKQEALWVVRFKQDVKQPRQAYQQEEDAKEPLLVRCFLEDELGGRRIAKVNVQKSQLDPGFMVAVVASFLFRMVVGSSHVLEIDVVVALDRLDPVLNDHGAVLSWCFMMKGVLVNAKAMHGSPLWNFATDDWIVE